MESSKVLDPKKPLHLQVDKFLIKCKNSDKYIKLAGSKVVLWEKTLYTNEPELQWEIYALEGHD
jgi:hypothetical protein